MRELPSFDDDPPPRRIKLMGDMRLSAWRELTPTAKLRRDATGEVDPDMTPRQRIRRRRDLVILLCHEVGLSGRQIGEVFGMDRKVVNDIIAKARQRHVGDDRG